ncbi:hypothetical protein WN55_10641 [Dufourea novaeangliae]|uniref:Uncharacterized protein n=1 Tax=Dufourea novaeangliae TaxID=178035 RepID=A0A154P4E4_DUFNO|nr:hypothetical protein WN55_10641 [Dufourea novaeangliae]
MIGRNVESFMQSRGFFTGRRSTDENSRGIATAYRSNGEVIRDDYRSSNRLEERGNGREANYPRYGRAERNHRDRSVCSKNVCPQERGTVANYVDRDEEMQPRRTRQRDPADAYENRNTWRAGPSDLNVGGGGSKPILRNGISHRRGERLYSSTLPRRNRTINFRDQLSNSLESRRCYPKSLQDLSGLELDGRIRDRSDVPSFLSNNWRDDRLDDGQRRRRHREDQLQDDYLRLYRNLSRLDKYAPGGKYEPGQEEMDVALGYRMTKTIFGFLEFAMTKDDAAGLLYL